MIPIKEVEKLLEKVNPFDLPSSQIGAILQIAQWLSELIEKYKDEERDTA